MTNIDGNTSESTIDDGRTPSISESFNTNLFEDDIAPDFIRNLGQTIVENFRKCTENIIIDNSEIMTIVNQAIGEQREIFREFIEASIKSNDNLSTFSVDILFFVECFKNADRYSNEDILDLLTERLEEAEKNYDLTKDLKNILSKGTNETLIGRLNTTLNVNDENVGTSREEINENEFIERLDEIINDENIGMKEKLTNIHNFLREYINEIKESPHKIDSVKESKIRVMLNKILKFLKDHPYCTTIGTFAFLGGSVLIGRVILAILVYLTGSAGIFCNDVAMKWERDGLVEKINHVCDGLNSIVVEIGDIETFWLEQIERIKYLIENLPRFTNENARLKRHRIANQIEKKWKDVGEDCKNYSRLMRNVLNRDRLIGS